MLADYKKSPLARGAPGDRERKGDVFWERRQEATLIAEKAHLPPASPRGRKVVNESYFVRTEGKKNGEKKDLKEEKTFLPLAGKKGGKDLRDFTLAGG